MKKLLCLALFLVAAFSLSAQNADAEKDEKNKDKKEKEKGSFWDNVYYTGGGTFNVSNQVTQIGASPTLGYNFNQFFSVGLGLSYQYLDYRQLDFDTHAFGTRSFLRGRLPNNILISAEYEGLSLETNTTGEREWRQAFLAGGGYSARLGNNLSINILMLYNLNFGQNDALYADEFVPRVDVAYNF